MSQRHYWKTMIEKEVLQVNPTLKEKKNYIQKAIDKNEQFQKYSLGSTEKMCLLHFKNAWKDKLFKTKILIQCWVDNTYRMKYMVTVTKKWDERKGSILL